MKDRIGKDGMKGSRYVLMALMGLMLWGGCQDQAKMADPEAALKARAEAYWKTRLMDQDYKATYEMELAEGALPYEEYLNRVRNAGQIKYVSVKVEEVTLDEDKGEVKLAVKCNIPPVPKAIDMPLLDQWVIKANEWRHVLPDKNLEPVFPTK